MKISCGNREYPFLLTNIFSVEKLMQDVNNSIGGTQENISYIYQIRLYFICGNVS